MGPLVIGGSDPCVGLATDCCGRLLFRVEDNSLDFVIVKAIKIECFTAGLKGIFMMSILDGEIRVKVLLRPN